VAVGVAVVSSQPAESPAPPMPAVALEVVKTLPPVSRPFSAAERAATETRAQLVALLQSPQGIRTAMLLREVLDAPLCRRGRR
jgi:hypothetical protein